MVCLKTWGGQCPSTYEEDSRVPRAAYTSASANANSASATNVTEVCNSGRDGLGVSLAQVGLAGDRETLLPSLLCFVSVHKSTLDGSSWIKP